MSKKYITLNLIRTANLRLIYGPKTELSAKVRALMPSKENIVAAGNHTLAKANKRLINHV